MTQDNRNRKIKNNSPESLCTTYDSNPTPLNTESILGRPNEGDQKRYI